VGETWRTDRWRSFRLNTCRWMSRLPGQALADARRDGFDTAPEFAEGLTGYARDRGLPVRTSTGAASVARSDGGFSVKAPDEAYAARNVVVATGFQKLPLRPAAAASLSARVLQLDTATYRDPASLPGGGVLVAGGGQSGAQIAEDPRPRRPPGGARAEPSWPDPPPPPRPRRARVVDGERVLRHAARRRPRGRAAHAPAAALGERRRPHPLAAAPEQPRRRPRRPHRGHAATSTRTSSGAESTPRPPATIRPTGPCPGSVAKPLPSSGSTARASAA
jgi:Pyridine nucleotide-disulphide oxidoreductase